MRCFAFRLWGKYGHFRKFFTTASAISHDFPPPTTIRGLVGAVVGLERGECIQKTKDLAVGIIIEKVEDKFFIGLNLLNLKYRVFTRTQANRQVLVNPSYIVYVCGQGQVYEKFVRMVTNSESYYTPYLGKSSYLCQMEPIGEFEAGSVKKSNSICGVFPCNLVENVDNLMDLTKDNELFRDRIPVSFEVGRIEPKYTDVFYVIGNKELRGEFKVEDIYKEPRGKSEVEGIYRVGDRHVYLFASRYSHAGPHKRRPRSCF